ncbi:hypothetical protein [Tunturiibacter empetritectus]|uniref:hypothetical protein n=1 Tax=Tunturiibacter empetritectus TaxID=3069691 RepID=UPI003D9B7338
MSATKPAEKEDARRTSTLRQQLIALLHGGQAHATFDEVINDFPASLRGTVPPNLPYSAWQILDHLRITQRDILNFSAPPTGGYHGMKWPDEYWPKSPSHPPPTPGTSASQQSAPTPNTSNR